ncbi:MAG TPA: RidA family protein [Blastocatellia bacterium]|jgi:2-iminobutanoate/2-iminopropanoate deaminase|nr:RidA family protein [Blastocatellia bacterium]
MNSQRRKILKAAAATAIAAPAAKAAAGKSKTSEPQKEAATKKVHYKGGKKPERKPGDQPPLFSGAVSYGNLLFIAGKGAHFEGDIKAHTKHVLDEIEKELVNAGSSMEKVLKCNVYLNDLKDYQAMNEVFRGRFGEEPPVRTTIAAAGGIPGNSLVEIDVIAYI